MGRTTSPSATTARAVTVRYDRARGALLFDSDIDHGWKMNPSNAPDAEALVPDNAPTVQPADPHHPIGFSLWKATP